jgi:hypothetical protein
LALSLPCACRSAVSTPAAAFGRVSEVVVKAGRSQPRQEGERHSVIRLAISPARRCNLSPHSGLATTPRWPLDCCRWAVAGPSPPIPSHREFSSLCSRCDRNVDAVELVEYE